MRIMAGEVSRRTFVRKSVLASAGVAMGLGTEAGKQAALATETSAADAAPLPKGDPPQGQDRQNGD